MPNARLAEDIGQTAPHRSDRNAEPVGVGHRCRQNAGLDPYSVFEQRLRGAIDKQRPCAGIDKNESLIEAIEAGERAAARKVKVMDAPLKGGGMDEMPRQSPPMQGNAGTRPIQSSKPPHMLRIDPWRVYLSQGAGGIVQPIDDGRTANGVPDTVQDRWPARRVERRFVDIGYEAQHALIRHAHFPPWPAPIDRIGALELGQGQRIGLACGIRLVW